jgi:thioredoxin reductase
MSYDAIVIGGSYAGLSAAMQLARARRSVLVIDAGEPRNGFAAASHGFFGQDGMTPHEMIEQARTRVLAYPTVTFRSGTAVAAQRVEPARFEVTLESGEAYSAARLILAHGITDGLPEIPGLAERWGRSVLHCPYCHGYEVAGRKLGVLSGPIPAPEHARLIADWGPVTLFLNGAEGLDDSTLGVLRDHGITVEPAPIAALEGNGRELAQIRLADGRQVAIDALFVSPTIQLNPLAEQLGCEFDEAPMGRFIRTDQMKMTTVPGVFAAGDAAIGAGNATIASAAGVIAGVAAHKSLIFGLPG